MASLRKQVQKQIIQVNWLQIETKQLLSGKRFASDARAEKACRGSCHHCDWLQSWASQIRGPCTQQSQCLSSWVRRSCSLSGSKQYPEEGGDWCLFYYLKNSQTSLPPLLSPTQKGWSLSGGQPGMEGHGGALRPGLVNTRRELKECQGTRHASLGRRFRAASRDSDPKASL